MKRRNIALGLLGTIITLAPLGAYTQTDSTSTTSPFKDVEWGYGPKKEKPEACIVANNLTEDLRFFHDKYFSMNLTDQNKKKLKGTKLEGLLDNVFSGILNLYEDYYVKHEDLVDGIDKNIEATNITISKIRKRNREKFRTNNFEIENLDGKYIFFLTYNRNGKEEQIPYILENKKEAKELVKELR